MPGTLPARPGRVATARRDEPDEAEDPDELDAGAGFDELPDDSDEVLLVSLFDSLLDSPAEPFDDAFESPDDESEPDPVDGLVELDLPRLSVL